MIILPGVVALSEFRKEKILKELKAFTACEDIETQYYYFLDCDALGEEKQIVINQLLNIAGNAANQVTQKKIKDNHHELRFVVPRLGTISPWSTKATDIFHLCGLKIVKRVERGIQWRFYGLEEGNMLKVETVIHDPMTESILQQDHEANRLFEVSEPLPLVEIDLLSGGAHALAIANEEFGFALSTEEQQYLVSRFQNLERNPTDVELMMFAQVNSEHCRHKIFNADWTCLLYTSDAADD